MKIDWTCRSRWTTAWCSAPTCSVPRRTVAIRRFFLWPYGKGLAFQEGYKTVEIMARDYPDGSRAAATGTPTGKWSIRKSGAGRLRCVRVDSRGAGRSPGYLCHNNARETRDIHLCVEWRRRKPGAAEKSA